MLILKHLDYYNDIETLSLKSHSEMSLQMFKSPYQIIFL